MNIDISHYIKDYLTTKFSGKFKLSSNGRELIMNSPIDPTDRRQHFSINLWTGLWQDFRKGEKGNFFQLYSYLEGVSYNQAVVRIQVSCLNKEAPKAEPQVPTLPLQEETKHFVEVSLGKQPESALEIATYLYLLDRKILTDKFPFFVAIDGRFKDRVILPFWRNDDLVYFQARALRGQKPKYLNPGAEFGLKSKNFLYPFDLSRDYVVVCEGPIDAMSLQAQGVNATATLGCSLSTVQAKILAGFQGRIIVGYDNDEAGRKGLENVHRTINTHTFRDISYCFPSNKFKDWNDMHALDVNLTDYVKENTLPFDSRVFQISNQINNINSLSGLNSH